MGTSWLRNVFAHSLKARKAPRSHRKLAVECLELRVVPASRYDIQWLGTLSPTHNHSAAQGINDFGQVVGNSYVADSNGIPTIERAFLYTPGTGMVDLGAAGATGAFAWDINDSGRVTGWIHEGGSLASGGYWEWAAIWDNGVGHTIPGYGQPGMSSVAYGVNDHGVVVGHSDTLNWSATIPNSEAFVYDGNTVRFLGTLGGHYSYAMDINNAGYVAGFADTGENPSGQPGVYMSRYHAVIWAPNGTVQDLGTFGTDSYTNKINASGHAVGYSQAADGYYHAFLYNGTQLVDLGTTGENSMAWAINDAGLVVGDTGNWQASTAFLYENGVHFDLNTLVNGLASDTLLSAHDINNWGQIVGYGQHNGQYEAFVLTPVGTVVPPPPPPTGNRLPSADAGGPYALIDGQALSLDASASSDPDGDALTYSWDVNGDGVFGDASGATPTLTASNLHALGVFGAGTYTVAVRVNDGQGGIATSYADLSVAAAPPGPLVEITGPSDGFQGVTGQIRTFTLSVIDPVGDEYEYQIQWGDGASDDFSGPADVTANHVYLAAGEYSVVVIATDDAGQTGTPVTLAWTIRQAEQQGTVLAIGGTGEDDTFLFAAGETAGTVITPFGTFATGQVMVYGGAGSDRITVQGRESADTFGIHPTAVALGSFFIQGSSVENWRVDGLAGDDTFYLNGGGLPISLQGGDGADRFKVASVGAVSGQVDGGAGSDILDYALYHSPVTVDLQARTATATAGIVNIEGFVGSNLFDTLVGANTTNTWAMNGYNAGTIGTVQFSSFENWVGGTGADTFKIANARYVSGQIDGGLGSNSLDYSVYTSGVSVNLATGTATNVRGGIVHIAHVTGGAGTDTLTGDAGDNILLGNAGNDVLNGGTGGNDVLVGGAGNDNLTGSAGRNLLIGGLGADVLLGGAGEDILMGGTTNFDANTAALTSLMAEWKRTDLSYQQRLDHLTGTTAGGLNGSTKLTSSTVKDDTTTDQIRGMGSLDWFWARAAELLDLELNEKRS